MQNDILSTYYRYISMKEHLYRKYMLTTFPNVLGFPNKSALKLCYNELYSCGMDIN